MRWRLGVWVALILSWLIMLLYMWAAFATLPSSERLDHSRMMPIPTLGSVVMLAARSAVELGTVLGLLLPWWRSLYALRLLVAAVLLVTWFIITTPLTISAMDWVHRRWIVAVAAALILCFCIAIAARLLRRPRAASPGEPSA